jgi:hypothetical protein
LHGAARFRPAFQQYCIETMEGAARQRRPGQRMPGKRVQFDDETWSALDLLARDRMMDFQELAEEAFRDLLRKHNRPVDLKSALRQSAGERVTVHSLPKKKHGRK